MPILPARAGPRRERPVVKRRRWFRRLPAPAPGCRLRGWLQEPGSLTRRCQRLCQDFRVQLLRQARAADCIAPGQTRARQTWVREVLLCCDGVPVIFAHTTLSTVNRGRLNRWLARLGSRSLGSLLFAHPGFRRGPIEFCRLDGRDPLYRALAAAWPAGTPLPPSLWARRSTHALAGQRVCVCEVFLPAILSLPAV